MAKSRQVVTKSDMSASRKQVNLFIESSRSITLAEVGLSGNPVVTRSIGLCDSPLYANIPCVIICINLIVLKV